MQESENAYEVHGHWKHIYKSGIFFRQMLISFVFSGGKLNVREP